MKGAAHRCVLRLRSASAWRRVTALAALLLMLPLVRSAAADVDAGHGFAEVCTSSGMRLVPLDAWPADRP